MVKGQNLRSRENLVSQTLGISLKTRGHTEDLLRVGTDLITGRGFRIYGKERIVLVTGCKIYKMTKESK